MPNTREKMAQCYLKSVDKCLNTKCRECEYFSIPSKPIRRCQAYMVADDLIANGVTFAEDNNVPNKWIPVTERLPHELLTVIIAVPNGKRTDVMPAYLANGWWKASNDWCYETDKVSHWMPLPEPPKGE